jgi:hypothetical protein
MLQQNLHWVRRELIRKLCHVIGMLVPNRMQPNSWLADEKCSKGAIKP